MLMGTILRANLITVTTLDKWKAVFVNSNSLPLYNETQRGDAHQKCDRM